MHSQIAKSLADSPKLGFSIEEACVISGLSRATLFRQLVAGRLASIRDGRRRLIARNDLEGLLARMRETNHAGAR
jgi:excisionase family DNA binding protein